MNRAINLRFRSLAVDHFGNLASYSAIRRRKTMVKTMTSAKSRRRSAAVVPRSERFRLPSPRPSLLFLSVISSQFQWKISRTFDRSLLHTAQLDCSADFPRNFHLFVSPILFSPLNSKAVR